MILETYAAFQILATTLANLRKSKVSETLEFHLTKYIKK